MKNFMPTADLLALTTQEMNTLNRKDLARATRQLADVANKRYDRIRKSSIHESPATMGLEQNGGRFGSLKGKTINELRHEFARAQKFLNSKTSTIKGYQKVRKQTIARIGSQTKDWTEEDWKKYWDAYNLINNSEGGNYAQYLLGSDQLQEMLRDVMIENPNVDSDNILNNIDTLIDDFQKKKEEDWVNIDEEFFDLFGI
jgi:hypothetical protein